MELGSREGISQQVTSLVFHFCQDQLLAHPARLSSREENSTPSSAAGYRFGSVLRTFITCSSSSDKAGAECILHKCWHLLPLK